MRIALCNGYEMKISENRKIRIADEAGRGAGCIVYDAIYWDQMQIKHKIRVRECYPAYIQLTRAATGELVPSGNPEKFEKAKKHFLFPQDYKRAQRGQQAHAYHQPEPPWRTLKRHACIHAPKGGK